MQRFDRKRKLLNYQGSYVEREREPNVCTIPIVMCPSVYYSGFIRGINTDFDETNQSKQFKSPVHVFVIGDFFMACLIIYGIIVIEMIDERKYLKPTVIRHEITVICHRNQLRRPLSSPTSIGVTVLWPW